MASSRSALRLVLVILLTSRCGEFARDCKFITCRDCTTMGCSWAPSFDRDHSCVATTKGLPEVKSEVYNPKDCAEPTCVMPHHDAWDAEEFAQLLGGIFGGLLAGLFGGAGIENWRQARSRVGYKRIGGKTWADLARAFFGACLGRFARADEEAGGEAARRNAHLGDEARRAEEAREPKFANPPINPPQQEGQNSVEPEPVAEPVGNLPADNPQVVEAQADSDDDYDDADEDNVQAKEPDSDDDSGDGSDNGQAPPPAVQQMAGLSRSERQAAAKAKLNMAAQR